MRRSTLSIPLPEFSKTGAISSAFGYLCPPVRPGPSLDKSKSCYPIYLITPAKNEFVLATAVQKDRGYSYVDCLRLCTSQSATVPCDGAFS
jgi:hypothetical protein